MVQDNSRNKLAMKKVIALQFVLMLLCAQNAYAATISGDFSTNLIAHWTMDETSGTRYDSTASDFDLTDNNTVSYGTGKQGNAADIEVDNLEYLSGGDWTGFDNVTKLSVSAWINLESTSADPRYIITKWNNASQPAGSSFRIYISSDNKLHLDSYNSANSYVSYYGSTAISTGTWYHMVMVWDSAATGNKLQFYLNGSAETMSGSGTVGTIKDTTTIVNIGSASDSDTGRRWDGMIDEVSVWSGRALTSSEVSTIYNSGSGIAYGSPATATTVYPTIWTFFD